MSILSEPFTVDPSNDIRRIMRMMMPFLDLEFGPWLAGGSVARMMDGGSILDGSDMDLFFASEDLFKWAVGFYEQFQYRQRQNEVIQYVSKVEYPQSVMFNFLIDGKPVPIQLIKKKFHESPEALLDDFDFTACMFATDGETLVYDDRAKTDLKNKMLILHMDPKRPKPNRLAKYTARGFTPGPGVMSAYLGAHLPAWNIGEFTPAEGLYFEEY